MPIARTPPPERSTPDRRTEILALLARSESALAVRDVADAIGVHTNTARAHLDGLVRSGHVTRTTEVRSMRGRPRELFEPTGTPTSDRDYERLARVLADGLSAGPSDHDNSDAAEDAGRRWARSQVEVASHSVPLVDAVGHGATGLVGVLARAGFAPDLTPDSARGDADPLRLRLQHCPFLEVAQTHPHVVCAVHRGLMQETLDITSGEPARVRLDSFVAPGLCTAEITRT